MTTRSHDAERLEAIREAMRDLLTEARDLVRRRLTRVAQERAERTWMAHLEMALDADSRWLVRPEDTLESEIERLRET